MPINDDQDDYRNGWPPEPFEGDPCFEPGGMVEPLEIADLFPDERAGGGWYPGAHVVSMGGNGGAITARPAENILHIAASAWNIDPSDPTNPNKGIAGWNQGARACTGYNDQYGALQQYASVWSSVNGTKDGNWRCRTWEAWNPEGLNGTAEQYNSSTYTAEQCERFSDLLAWDHIENGALLDDMTDSRRASHGCGVHRYGIDPWRISSGEVWTAHAGKTCPGTARVRQLPGIVGRARVIAAAVRAGRCTYLPPGRVNIATARARTGDAPDTKDWFDMATKDDLKGAIAEVLGRGGQVPNFGFVTDVLGATLAQVNTLTARLEALEAALPKAVWDHPVPSFVSNDEQQARNMLAWTNQAAEAAKAQTAPKA